ncbi:MAG: GNAT family N-acetyltransferase [Ignavibacteriales bacterium]|nr:GNAT family N-acetyltransferase [Ignavibacteriales bacterium]
MSKDFDRRPDIAYSNLLPIVTERTVMRVPSRAEAPLMARYYKANRERFARYEPEQPAEYDDPNFWKEELLLAQMALAQDQALTLAIYLKANQTEIVGQCRFVDFQRGPFQACRVGYHIDERHEGKGLMTEALGAATRAVFERLKMKRIVAYVVIENERSARLLERLGYEREGTARSYCLVGEEWRDCLAYAAVNPEPI